nr:MAG TPA: hypothetical protein [Caudoviricetes sp.]
MDTDTKTFMDGDFREYPFRKTHQKHPSSFDALRNIAE